jgi:hypothetical protein
MRMTTLSLHRPLRRALLAAAFAVLPFAAAAADPPAAAPGTPKRTIAILSLLGDELTMVVRRFSTGSQVDPNRRESIPIDDPAFDKAAMDAAERAFEAEMPGAERLRFGIRDKALFAIQDGLLEPGPASDGMRKGLQGLLAKTGATHLLLVTKRRDEFLFKLADGNTTGIGKVSGVGIFIDNSTSLRSTQTGQINRGFFVCYAYVKLTLIEAATLRVVATRNGTEQIMTSAATNTTSTAWDALTDKEKVEHLIHAIDGAVYAATREIAAAR